MVAFLQIVTFAGIYFKLGDIMSMFNLQSNDSQSMSRRVMRKPQMLMNRKFRQLNRNVGRALAFDGGVAVAGKLATDSTKENRGSKAKDYLIEETNRYKVIMSKILIRRNKKRLLIVEPLD